MMRMTRTSDNNDNNDDNNNINDNNNKDAGQIRGTMTRDENDDGQ